MVIDYFQVLPIHLSVLYRFLTQNIEVYYRKTKISVNVLPGMSPSLIMLILCLN